MNNTTYITTPIFYPSGRLHMGHFYTLSIAQVIKNFRKLIGRDVIMLTGTDEHGEKIQKVASKAGMMPQEYVDQYDKYFHDFIEKCKFNIDIFSRTTDSKHISLVKDIFNEYKKKGEIYKGTYEGWYSIQDEEYVPTKNILVIDEQKYHPESKHPLVRVSQTTYFYDLQKYKKWIRDFLAQNEFQLLERSQRELINNFLDADLENLSVSRNNFDWGIHVPEDEEHVIYVWMDALFNYLSALGYRQSDDSLYRKYWENGGEIIQIVGKEITRFHCVYWPIFLHSLSVRQPSKIIAHGWLISGEHKMSKSRENTIDPIQIIEAGIPPEVIRYYLLRKSGFGRDMMFDKEELLQFYNTEIVNLFGNSFSRVINLLHKRNAGCLRYVDTLLQDMDVDILNLLQNNCKMIKNFFMNNNINAALQDVVNTVRAFNVYLEKREPWKITSDEEVMIVFVVALNVLYGVLTTISPILNEFAQHYQTILKIVRLDYDKIDIYDKFDNVDIDRDVIFYKRI